MVWLLSQFKKTSAPPTLFSLLLRKTCRITIFLFPHFPICFNITLNTTRIYTNTFYTPVYTTPIFLHHTQGPVNNQANVIIHLLTQFCYTHLQPMANKRSILYFQIRLILDIFIRSNIQIRSSHDKYIHSDYIIFLRLLSTQCHCTFMQTQKSTKNSVRKKAEVLRKYLGLI